MKPSKIGLAYFLENVNSVGWKEKLGQLTFKLTN